MERNGAELRADSRTVAEVERVARDRRGVAVRRGRGIGTCDERYRAGEEILGNRPPDELARRLFAHGGIEAVHIYSNVVTVDLAEGERGDGLEDIVGSLFVYYDHDEEAPAEPEEGVKTPAE